MNFFKRYIDYVQDNPEGYWFKRKIWGWGWTPVTWQGWLVTLLLIAFVVWRGIVFDTVVMAGNTEPTQDQLFWFFAQVIGAVLVLIVVAWRTGAPPKWQWGIPKKEDKI